VAFDTDRRRVDSDSADISSPERWAVDGPLSGRRRSDRVAATLIAALPHELRRSLGVISLLSDGVDTSREAGEQIALEVRRIDRLIDAMAEISRVTSGGEKVRIEPLAPARVLSAAVGAFAHDPDHCDVIVDRDDSLPPVRANPVLAEVILLNLLSNASRYGRPPVVLQARRGGRVVEFGVRDAGGGFARDRASLPAAPTADVIPGAMGVGLSISRLFAAEMGGWLVVESDTNGSCVSLCLPVAAIR